MRAADIVRSPGVPAGMFASAAILAAVDIITAYLPVIGERNGIGPAVVGALPACGPPPRSCRGC